MSSSQWEKPFVIVSCWNGKHFLCGKWKKETTESRLQQNSTDIDFHSRTENPENPTLSIFYIHILIPSICIHTHTQQLAYVCVTYSMYVTYAYFNIFLQSIAGHLLYNHLIWSLIKKQSGLVSQINADVLLNYSPLEIQFIRLIFI